MSFNIRTSERTMFKRCPQRWQWAYNEDLKSTRPKAPLWFGSAMHEALAEWYQPGLKRGAHPAETIVKELEGMRKIIVVDEEGERQYAEAAELGEQMMNRYVKFYGEDPSWDVIATEQTFQVWIPNPVNKADKRWVRYVGTVDGVFRDLETDEVWLMEHKSAAQIITTHLPMDDQAGSYWAIMNSKLRRMGVLKGKESLSGIRYNFIRKALDDPRPLNEDGLATNKPLKSHYIDALTSNDIEVNSKLKVEELAALAEESGLIVLGDPSATQPPPYFERVDVYRSIAARKNMIKRIQQEAQVMEAMKNGTLPIYKVPTRDCSWQCEFWKLCQMDEEGSEFVEDFKEAEFTTFDPYADHNKDQKSQE